MMTTGEVITDRGHLVTVWLGREANVCLEVANSVYTASISLTSEEARLVAESLLKAVATIEQQG